MQSDKRLVRLFRRGVDPAFDELVTRHRVSLVNFAAAIAGRDRADDVVQDALVKAHRSLSRDQPDEVAAWLYRIVRNTALNDIRDNSKHRHDELGHATGSAEQPHEVLLRRERLATVVAAVAELPASQRTAIVGRELGGFTHDEIAAQLDLSTGATKQLIYRARLTLREALGALIPFPVIAWLVADAAGVYTAGTAGGAAAGAAMSAASGGGAAAGAGATGAASGGVLAALAGSGAAKVAVVAVMAGGSLAAGIAVERGGSGATGPPDVASAAGRPTTGGSGGAEGPQMAAGVLTGDDAKPRHDKAGDGGSGEKPGSRGGSGSGDDSGGEGRDDHSGSSGSGSPAGGDSGDDRGETGKGGYTDDGREPSRSGGGGRDRTETPSSEPVEPREAESPSKPEKPEYEPPEKPEAPEYEPPEDEHGGDSAGGSGHGSSNEDD